MKRWLDLLIPGLLLVAAIGMRMNEPAAVEQMRNLVFDEYQRFKPRAYTPQPVKIIDIDEESLRRLGQWPWPRHHLALLVDRLAEFGVAAIGFDVIFAEPDRTAPRNFLVLWPQAANDPELRSELMRLPDPDEVLAAALARSRSVTAFALLNATEASQQATLPPPKPAAGFAENGDRAGPFVGQYAASVRSLAVLEAAAAANGFVNTEPDLDGIVRRVPLILGVGEQLFPALAAEALRIAQQAGSYVVRASGASQTLSFGTSSGIDSIKIGAAVVPTDRHGSLVLYDSGHVADRFVPVWEVMEPDFDPNRIAGQIVLLGTTVQGLKDLRSTPLDAAMPGVEIHAQMLEQMISGTFLVRPDWADGAEVMYLAVFGMVLIFVLRRVGALPTLAIALTASGAAVAASWTAFSRAGWLVDPLFPCFVVLLVYMSGTLIGYLRTEGEKRFVRRTFSRYLSPVVVERLTQNPERISLGGEIRELTLMFCDIQGFTRISEQLDPQSLTQLVNRFLTPMTTVIEDRQHGTVDKYIGDCIMAFWNAPLDDPEHAAHALLAALEMRSELARLNLALKEEAAAIGRPAIQIAVGIGLNTGPGCVGNFGSEQRLEYSVIGDSVNLASRLEGLTRAYGVDIVLGEDTAKRVDGFALLELDQVQVKGRDAPLRIYAALGGPERAADPAFISLAEAHTAMIAAYRRQDWDEAAAALAVARSLDVMFVKLYALYEARIAEYRAEALPSDWDGVYVAQTKSG
jgi:adenylate cyclase